MLLDLSHYRTVLLHKSCYSVPLGFTVINNYNHNNTNKTQQLSFFFFFTLEMNLPMKQFSSLHIKHRVGPDDLQNFGFTLMSIHLVFTNLLSVDLGLFYDFMLNVFLKRTLPT